MQPRASARLSTLRFGRRQGMPSTSAPPVARLQRKAEIGVMNADCARLQKKIDGCRDIEKQKRGNLPGGAPPRPVAPRRSSRHARRARLGRRPAGIAGEQQTRAGVSNTQRGVHTRLMGALCSSLCSWRTLARRWTYYKGSRAILCNFRREAEQSLVILEGKKSNAGPLQVSNMWSKGRRRAAAP